MPHAKNGRAKRSKANLIENNNCMQKYFYTIGEVATILNESTSLVRFWANEFPKFIKPQRNAKGNRLFTEQDVKNLRTIHHLVKVEGLTLEGAAKRLKEEVKGGTDKMKVRDSLRQIRNQLSEIRSEL